MTDQFGVTKWRHAGCDKIVSWRTDPRPDRECPRCWIPGDWTPWDDRPAPDRVLKPELIHPPAKDLLILAVDHGWSAALAHGWTCTDEDPYVTVRAQRQAAPYAVEVTWSTRDSGRYRLSSALIGSGARVHTSSLTKVKAALTSPPGGSDAP